MTDEKKLKKPRSKRSFRANWFTWLNTIFFILFSLMTLYPIWYVIVGSFNNGVDYTAGGVWLWPREFTLDNYRVVVNDLRIWRGFGITIARTLVGTVLSLLFVAIVAYAMSRRELKGRKIFYYINIFTMFFGGGLIPTFLVIKWLGLLDSFWVYIIPGIYSVYNMIIMRSFFSSIPSDLREAAYVDGAGEYRIFFQIYLPLSTPVLATVGLWIIVGHWNTYIDAMYYVTNQDLFPLQYVLMRIINETSTPSSSTSSLPPMVFENVSAKTVSLAAIIISILPILCVYPFLQKFFTKGVTVGSLKG
ncbi:MAG: carbohydrate ABC transporter permease [Clostridia bacterium]|nr:carbohydrate ABC transporter permease [Clostridia bacterium]